MANLRGALTTSKTTHHAAIVDPPEVGTLLKTLDGYTGQAVTRTAMRLSPHLFVRPRELRQAEWAEIDVDKRALFKFLERTLRSFPATSRCGNP